MTNICTSNTLRYEKEETEGLMAHISFMIRYDGIITEDMPNVYHYNSHRSYQDK